MMGGGNWHIGWCWVWAGSNHKLNSKDIKRRDFEIKRHVMNFEPHRRGSLTLKVIEPAF
jgi:hypothetical protein